MIGNDEGDDPPGMLGSRALVCGIRCRLGLIQDPVHGFLQEPPAARPLPVELRQNGARGPYQRFARREDLHDAAVALYLPVRAFLDVARAQPHVVGIGEVQVRQGIGLRVFEKPAGRSYKCACGLRLILGIGPGYLLLIS